MPKEKSIASRRYTNSQLRIQTIYTKVLKLTAMLNALTGRNIYRSRVDSDNYTSQNLMKKLGAKPNGISEMLIHGEELQKFQKKNSNLIDDKVRALADEFGVAPIDLIGHVLEFRIEWKPTNFESIKHGNLFSYI